jgi:16S rRNA processing protein RimM
MSSSPRILLGHIVGAHGIRGEVMIRSYAEVPDDIGAYGPLADAAGKRTFEIVQAKAGTKGVIARIRGVDDRTAAEALKGIDLYVDRAALPDVDEGEVYQADLTGMQAVTPEGADIGVIVGVANYGAGDILEIRKPGVSDTELVPYMDAFVRDVDIKARRIVIIRPTYLEDENDEH